MPDKIDGQPVLDKSVFCLKTLYVTQKYMEEDVEKEKTYIIKYSPDLQLVYKTKIEKEVIVTGELSEDVEVNYNDVFGDVSVISTKKLVKILPCY